MYAISLQNTITCSLKLAMLINEPWMFDVPENIEIHRIPLLWYENAMENYHQGYWLMIKIISKWCKLYHFAHLNASAFALLRKSLSKILTYSYRENHWSPKHHVPFLNLSQHAEEVRREVHCLLCLIFSESTLQPLVSKGSWKIG